MLLTNAGTPRVHRHSCGPVYRARCRASFVVKCFNGAQPSKDDVTAGVPPVAEPAPLQPGAQNSSPASPPAADAAASAAPALDTAHPEGPAAQRRLSAAEAAGAPRKDHNWASDPINQEILSIALPMLATLAADPIAGLVDTAYVGRLGPTQLAGVGVALSVFNTITKLTNMPLLSVTTSSVATARGTAEEQGQEKSTAAVRAAVSSSLLIAVLVGITQCMLLMLAGSKAAALWGLPPGSPLRGPALEFLWVRAVGAPVTVLLLVLQGCYRGFQDTRTPFYATIASNAINVILGALFIFGLRWGVRGAAAGTVVAQAIPCAWLLLQLQRRYGLAGPDAATMQQLIKLFAPTGFLMLRTASITITYAVATSLAARAGPAAAACHQVSFQLWLASSLLADSLAVASQTMLARSIAAQDTSTAQAVVQRTVGAAGTLGCGLGLALLAARGIVPTWFTSDPTVLGLLASVLPWVVLTQPVNALAFVWDGVLYGAGGFRYASVQMACAAIPSVAVMVLGTQFAARTGLGPVFAPMAAGLGGAAAAQLGWVWTGLSLVMAFRALSIWVPYELKLPPFKGKLWPPPPAAGNKATVLP